MMVIKTITGYAAFTKAGVYLETCSSHAEAAKVVMTASE
jgi:hypothetical protein